MGNTEYMSVNRNTLNDAKGFVQNDIGSFSSNAWEALEFFHSARNLSAKVGHYHLCSGDTIFCLIAIKANGVNNIHDILNVGLRHCFGSSIFFKE